MPLLYLHILHGIFLLFADCEYLRICFVWALPTTLDDLQEHIVEAMHMATPDTLHKVYIAVWMIVN